MEPENSEPDTEKQLSQVFSQTWQKRKKDVWKWKSTVIVPRGAGEDEGVATGQARPIYCADLCANVTVRQVH